MEEKRGQIGIEYLIIIGIIIVSVSSILVLAMYFSNNSKDILRFTQVEAYAKKIIASSESVYYSGEPSRATISVYLPEQIEDIQVLEEGILVSLRTNSGVNRRLFESNVKLSGSLSYTPGIKNVKIEANLEGVSVSNV